MRYQPQGLLRIDQGHPLAAGLRMAMLPGVNRGFDVGGMRTAAPSGLKQSSMPGGMAAGFGPTLGTGTTTDRIVTGVTAAFPFSGRSYYFRARRNGSGAGSLGRLFDKQNGNAGQLLMWYDTAGLLSYTIFRPSETNINFGSFIPTGGIFDVLVTHAYDGATSTISAYVNGVQVLNAATFAGALVDAPGTPLTIGNRYSDNARGWDGLIECAYQWDRVLSPDEATRLSADRYQIFFDPYVDDDPINASSVRGAALIGSAVAQATGSGTLTTSTALTGAAAAFSSGTGILSTSIALAGVAAVVASASASLITAIPLQGIAAASSSASGSLASGGIGLSGAAVTQATGSAALSTAIALKGTAASTASASAMLSTSISLTGAAMAVASAVATMVEGGTAAPGGPLVDVSKIPPDRIVVFDGSGSRIVMFEGSGSRMVIFEGSGSRVRFEQMSAKVPTKIGDKWTTDRDPDEISYYAADITQELLDRNTTADPNKITPVLFGVTLLEGPELQVATVAGVQRTFVVVKLGGVEADLPPDWRWVARVNCMNGERFDKTTWFNKVDP